MKKNIIPCSTHDEYIILKCKSNVSVNWELNYHYYYVPIIIIPNYYSINFKMKHTKLINKREHFC